MRKEVRLAEPVRKGGAGRGAKNGLRHEKGRGADGGTDDVA